MPKLHAPLKLSPVFKSKIWGMSDLEPLFDWPSREAGAAPISRVPSPRRGEGGEPVRPPLANGPERSEGAQDKLREPGEGPTTEFSGQDQLIGEAWVTDDGSKFLSGPLAGMTLGEASAKFRSKLYGSNWKGGRFPILAKYLFTSDWLSVQVHPDDRYARIHEPGSFGKCEMWYVLRADPGAEILLGLKSATTPEMLRSACEKGASKDLFYRFHPQAGEAIFVPPGTAHAIGPGLVLFEAEQNSDITYRLDDFGRLGLDGKPRPLHLEKGLAVTRPELPPYRNLPRVVALTAFGRRRYVVASRYFAVEELSVERVAHFKGAGERAETLSILAGEGRVETASGWLGYRAGDTWLVPPAAEEYRLAPTEKTRLLKFYVPELDRDFRGVHSRRGPKAAQLKEILFD